MRKINITIDGPAGSGKGVTSEQLAIKLGYKTIDSGAIYRTIALYLTNKGITPDTFKDSDIEEADICIDDKNHVFIEGEDTTNLIRTPEIGVLASKFADHIPVRHLSNRIQRSLVKGGGFILDGRDAGTVVLPDADLKIYLDASLETRAQRRLKDHKFGEVSIEELRKQIHERDERDRNKPFGALKPADDAVILDNSELTIEETVDKIHDLAQGKINA